MSRSATESRSTLLTAAVFLGTAVLIGLPTFLLVGGALESLLGGLGGPVVADLTPGSLVAFVVAFLFARWATVEITAVRLHGATALFRGSRREAVGRLAVVGAWTLGAFAAVAASVFRFAVAGWNPANPVAAAAAALLVVAVVGFAYVTARNFYRGYRGDPA